MKKLLFILLLFPLLSIGQDYTDFKPEVAWRTIVDSVVFQNTDTFTVKVSPEDLNDPGAFEKTVGNFLIDNKRRKYKIIDNSTLSDGILITVVDVFESGAAPFQGRIGFIVETPNGAFASGLSTYYGEELDRIAADYERALDLRIAYEKGQSIPNDSSRLWIDYTPTGTEPKGTSYFDKEHNTKAIVLGNGVVLQVGQEQHAQIENNTGDTLKNSRVVGFTGVGNRIQVAYASNDERQTFFGATTQDIAPDSIGIIVTLSGAMHDVNTGTLVKGLPIYLDTLGYFTNDRPSFPEYVYPLGTVIKEGNNFDGVIYFRSDGINFKQSILDAFDGAIRETFDFRTFSDGVNVYGVLSNPNVDNSDNLTLMFSDGWFDFAVPDTIQLSVGSSTVPQESYIYIPKSTKVLTSSTSAFTDSEHAKVAKITLLDAVNTQSYGALRNQNINNHLKYDDNNGHIEHMSDRMRIMNSAWENGVALSVSGTPTNLYVATTSGQAWQLHLQTFSAQDMSLGDDIHIVNDFTTPYRTTTNLNTITAYSDGSTWNNEWTNLVIWGVVNKSGETSHIMCNLSSAGYLTEENAFEDADNHSNYDIPRAFRGVGFLIGRITVRRSPAGYTYNSSTGFLDLRGKVPNNTIGSSGGGASGYTTFDQLEDTPSTKVGSGGYFVKVADAENALEYVDPSTILLTDFDSTGLMVDTSQVNGLNVFRNDISALQAESHPASTLITDNASILSQDEPTQVFTANFGNIDLDFVVQNGNSTAFRNINIGSTNNAGYIGLARGSDGNIAAGYGFFNSGAESGELRAFHVGGGGYYTWFTNNGSTTAQRMTLSNSGNLTVSGTVLGSNLSGTNTGDQDLSNYFNKVTDDTDDITEGAVNLFDKTVTFSGGNNVTIGGVYPSFTITDNSGTSNLALGETSTTAYRGDRGKIAYDHTLLTNNPHLTGLSNLSNYSTSNAVTTGDFTANGNGAFEKYTYVSGVTNYNNPTLGTSNGTFSVLSSNNLYGLYIGVTNDNGDTWIQAQRNDVATAYDIIMQESGGNVTIGAMTDLSTATPTTLSMGGSYSNSAGNNLKLKLYDSGVSVYGLGVSASSLDFNIPVSANYNFYNGDININDATFASDNSAITKGYLLNTFEPNITLQTVTDNGSQTSNQIIATGTNGLQAKGITSSHQPGLLASDNVNNNLYAKRYGSGVSVQLFGTSVGGRSFIGTEGSTDNGILFGTLSATNIIFGTNNTNRGQITSAGEWLVGYTADQGSYVGQFNGDVLINGNATIAADPYDSTWGTLTEAAPKDAVYDKIESIPTLSDGDKGDITVSGSGTVWNIDANTIGTTELSATGTPSSSTYLRGDNTWASVPSSQWTTDANGITYAGNVGIGGASSAFYKLYVPSGTSSISGISISSGALSAGSLTTGGSLTFDQASTVSSPSSGFNKIFTKSDDKLYIKNSAGTETVVGDQTSDFWLKKNFREINNPLNKVLSLKAYEYDYKSKGEYPTTAPNKKIRIEFTSDNKQRESAGLIAQDLEKIIPNAVNTSPNGYKSIDYNEVVPYLIEAIKEQQKQIDALKHEIELLR